MIKWLKNFKYWFIPNLTYLLNIISNRWTKLEVYGREQLELIADDTPILYAFWHGKLWLPAYYFRSLGYIALSSLHQDGEYMTRVLKRYGYRVIRGSSTRGGSRALLELIKAVKKGGTPFITPDGPTGPIYKVKPGLIYLQEKTAGIVVPIGVAIKRKKTFNSWDRLIFPLPGTRAVLVFGEPLSLPAEKTLEERAVLLEKALNKTEARAEQLLAGSGKAGG